MLYFVKTPNFIKRLFQNLTWEINTSKKVRFVYIVRFNKIISNSDFSQKSKELEELTKKVKDAHTFLQQANTLRYSGQKFTQQMEAEVSKKYKLIKKLHTKLCFYKILLNK